MAQVTSVLNVYQLDATVMDRNVPLKVAFPTQGCLLQDCSTSPARSLSSGYNVYGVIIVPSSAAANSAGTRYYVAETISQLVTIFNT